MPAPAISIIVPVYLGGIELVQCVRSILREVRPEDEVIVVADGASDYAWAEFVGSNVRVLVNPERRGPAHARNRGAEVATGDVLFFVDADCVVRPGTVNRVRRAFEADPSLDALIGSYDDEPGHPSFASQYRNLLHHYTHQCSRNEINTFWGACGAVRREAFLAVGGFDERYSWPSVEDIELGYRLTAAGYRIRMAKDVQVQHLKEWTAHSVVCTDLLLRAAPWTELLLRYGTLEDNLNTSVRSRLSVAAIGIGIGLAVAAPPLLLGGAVVASGVASAAAFASASAAVALNLPFYRYLRQIRGRRFALCAVPWHLLYFASAGAGAALGALRFALHKSPSSGKEPALRRPLSTPASAPELAEAA